MYSGSDSTGSQNYNNQWPLNPAAYQNTPNDQIDWAALAQQWIIMKEAGPPVPELTAPPPPKIQNVKKDNSFEGGEAPMEVENEKDDESHSLNWNDNSADPAWDWNQQQNWGWGNTWSAPPAVPPPAPGTPKAPLLPTPPTYNQYSSTNENSNNYGSYNRAPNEYTGGYWTASGSKMKPHNKRYSKVNVSTRPAISTPVIDPVMLDATKRKQLPAWIREGLEKMERDKQKQIEKEREKQEKQEVSEKSLFNEKEALEIIKSTVKERERSKFESDGDDSPFEGNNGGIDRMSPENVALTQEELMLKVRRTMTEILLKVTSQEIRAVCKEELLRHLRKRKASDQRVSAPSGTNVSGKLGLGMYGDSASSSENSDDDSEQTKNNSDIELKDTIKRRKAEFSKTEREIEARLAAAEKYHDNDSRGGTPKADSCDSQVDAKTQGHKIKMNKDTSPKSVCKRRKSRKDSISSSEDSDTDSETKKRVARSKKSSSSESSTSQKYTKDRTKHRNRENKSLSPDPKQKDKIRRSSDQKLKHSESSSSKSSSTRSRKSRSKSPDARRRKSRSLERDRHNSYKSYYSKRSPSRSSSGSKSSRSYSRSRRSRSPSYSKSRKSRSQTRSERSHRSRSHTRSERSRRSRSRSTIRSSKTHSRRKSKSYSPEVRHRRRLRSRSSSRGKRSHRH